MGIGHAIERSSARRNNDVLITEVRKVKWNPPKRAGVSRRGKSHLDKPLSQAAEEPMAAVTIDRAWECKASASAVASGVRRGGKDLGGKFKYVGPDVFEAHVQEHPDHPGYYEVVVRYVKDVG